MACCAGDIAKNAAYSIPIIHKLSGAGVARGGRCKWTPESTFETVIQEQTQSLYLTSPSGELFTNPFFLLATCFAVKPPPVAPKLPMDGGGSVEVWISPDPARQFFSPYLYAGNGFNPVNAKDEDGNDIIVLNYSRAALGAGHNAVLIGSPEMGYYYYSKAMGTSQHISGKYYRDAGHFLKTHPSYNKSVLFKTNSKEDALAREEALREVQTTYWIGSKEDHCAGVVDRALSIIGVKLDYKVLPNTQFEDAEKKANEHNKQPIEPLPERN